MTNQPFDLAAAKQKARTQADDDLVLAAGGAGNALDDILERLIADTNLSSAQKTSALQAIAVNAAGIVNAAMNNQSGPAALGGSSASSGQSSSAGISQQDYDDLKDEKEAAEAQNRSLLKDRKVLEQIVLDLNLSAPANTNTPFAADTATKVKAAIEAKEQAAQAAPADMILRTDVKASLQKIADAEDDLETTRFSTDIDGRDELKAAIADAVQQVS